MIRHTLFSLPFALSALLLETSGQPRASTLLWIVLAAVGARNAANALNRLIDRRIDKLNPRTAARHLPAGTLSPGVLIGFTITMLILLAASAAMLNPLCLALLPVAALLVFGYSYTKRFTWLCHLWLGLTCSAATMGAFLGVSGAFHFRYFPITAGVALWVAGFDIIYALQDIDFDRSQSLHSIPARFGAPRARAIAAVFHVATLAGLASVLHYWKETGPGTIVALIVCTVLLSAEQVFARRGSARHIAIAAYGINEIVPVVFLLGVAADLYLV